LKSNLKGQLIEAVLNEPRESEYMKADEGIYRWNLQLNQHFPFMKKAEKPPTSVENFAYLKNSNLLCLEGAYETFKDKIQVFAVRRNPFISRKIIDE